MGKVKPPKGVFDNWTPEQQEAYHSDVQSLETERDLHLDKASQHQAIAEDHEDRAWAYKTSMDENWGKHDSSNVAGGELGSQYMMYKHETIAEDERKKQRREKSIANEYDKQAKALKMDGEGSNPMTKQEYINETVRQRDADYAKMYELQAKQAALQKELDETWFFGKDDLRQQIAECQEQIDALQNNIAFNQKNLDNTQPLAPTPPIPPTPPGQTYVHTGAKLVCSLAIPFPATLTADPSRNTMLEGSQMANIMDIKPMVNIPCMGMCSTITNPAVAAATAAKLGVFTPASCVPSIPAPWKPGKANMLVNGKPALLNTDTLQCAWGGVITILPG